MTTAPLLALMLAATGPNDLAVRASSAFAPCLAPALERWRAEGGKGTLTVGEPGTLEGMDVDVVVGDDSELTHLLEGGALAQEVDLGYLPWFLVVPTGESSVSALSEQPVVVLGGTAGREARTALSKMTQRLRPSLDESELRAAPRRAVPSTLASGGQRARLAVRPLVATAAVVRRSAQAGDAQRFVDFLKSERSGVSRCLGPGPDSSSAPAEQVVYAQRVVDWWVPRCSLQRNVHNDPATVVGAPDAARIGPDRFRGMLSLGQAGWVVIDAGATIVDGRGADIRVYQTTSGEPVTVYAASAPEGPFALLALQEYCGVRSAGFFSNNCEFDLAAAGLTTARYLRIEDGEIYPCLAAGTASEGADIDAVAILNFR